MNFPPTTEENGRSVDASSRKWAWSVRRKICSGPVATHCSVGTASSIGAASGKKIAGSSVGSAISSWGMPLLSMTSFGGGVLA